MWVLIDGGPLKVDRKPEEDKQVTKDGGSSRVEENKQEIIGVYRLRSGFFRIL